MIVEINWAPIIGVMLVGFALLMWIAWSIVRDINAVCDTFQRPLDRYAAMQERAKERAE